MPRKDRHVFVYNKTKETFLAFRVDRRRLHFESAGWLVGQEISVTGQRGVDCARKCQSTPSECCLPLTWS